MFPWDPPKVGVSKSVLEKLEEELWNQLREVMLRSLQYFIRPPEIYILDVPPMSIEPYEEFSE